jgi:hypothetical protein
MKAIRATAIILVALALAACSDANNAYKVLNQAGYSDVTVTGYAPFTCSKDDTFSTGFVAKGPTGVPVKGTVCSSLLIKNSTIRIR